MSEKIIKRFNINVEITETKDVVRVRLHNTKLFKPDSFETQDVSGSKYTRRTIGRLKSTNKFETHSLIFNKKQFNRDQAIEKAKIEAKKHI